jgi:hypothetical protein
MTQFGRNPTSFSQHLRSKRRQLVAVVLMAGEWKHLTAEPQKFDAISIIPSQHLHDITGVGKTQGFHVYLAPRHICRLVPVWAVLRGMMGL